MERLRLAKAGVWYYRRRYGKLLPSFFQRIGQSRPQARFLVREVEEFERWLAAGKPEDADLHIADVAQVPGTDLVVRYKNGIGVAIINEDEARVTPEMADADAENTSRGRAKSLPSDEPNSQIRKRFRISRDQIGRSGLFFLPSFLG